MAHIHTSSWQYTVQLSWNAVYILVRNSIVINLIGEYDLFFLFCHISAACWTPYANSNVNGGVINDQSINVDQCKASCLAMNNCTGIDFNGNASTCYLFYIRNGPRYPNPGVTHYDLASYCSGIFTKNFIAYYLFIYLFLHSEGHKIKNVNLFRYRRSDARCQSRLQFSQWQN